MNEITIVLRFLHHRHFDNSRNSIISNTKRTREEVLAFWIWGVTKQILKDTAIRYAKTLLAAIDTLDTKK